MKQLAERLDAPPSTVAFWRDRFGEWIPAQGSGRARRYPPEALDALRIIATMSRAGTPQSVIESELQRLGFGRVIEAQPTTTTTTQQQDTTTAADLAAALQALTGEVAAMRQELLSSRREVAELRAALEWQRRALAAPAPTETQQDTTAPTAPASPLDRLRRWIRGQG